MFGTTGMVRVSTTVVVGITGTVRACDTVIGKRGALDPNAIYGHSYLSCPVWPQTEHAGYREVWPSRGLGEKIPSVRCKNWIGVGRLFSRYWHCQYLGLLESGNLGFGRVWRMNL